MADYAALIRLWATSDGLIAAPKTGASAPGLDARERLALSLTDDLVKEQRASDANMAAAIKMFGESGLTRSSC